MDFDNLVAFWIFSPLIILLFTTNLLEGNANIISKQTRWLAVFDFLLRFTLSIIVFLYLSHIITLKHHYIITLTIVGFLINLVLEYRLFKRHDFDKESVRFNSKQLDYLTEDYATNQTILIGKNEDEISEIKNIYSATFYTGITNILLLILLILGFFSFNFVKQEQRVLIFILGIIVTVIYTIFTNKKMRFGFNNQVMLKKVLFRDLMTFFIGVVLIFVLQGIVYYNTGIFNFIAVCIAVAFFIPTFSTNRKIQENFHKINSKYIDSNNQV